MSISDIVVSKYNETREICDDYYQKLTTQLDELTAATIALTPEIAETSYNYTVPNLTASARPDRPTIDPNAFITSFPAADLEEPTNTFDYNEGAYSSSLKDALKTKLETDIESGGTGLSASVEAAIQAREEARILDANAKTVETLRADLAARGWDIPAGPDYAMLHDQSVIAQRALTDSSNNILTETYKLGVQQTQHSETTATALEGTEMQHFDSVQARLLDAAKFLPTIVYERFKWSLTYWQAQITMETERIRALEAATNAQVNLYNADINQARQELEAQQGELSANVDLDKHKTQILHDDSVKNLDAILRIREMTIKTMEAIAGFFAQIGSAAMMAIHTSASLGYSEGNQVSTTSEERSGTTKSINENYNYNY